MELWIRTQDKSKLYKIEGIREIPLNVQKTDFEIEGLCYNEWYFLGKYNNEKRALKIIDAIQNILQPVLYWHEPEFELKQAGQVVYEMPEE